MLIMPIISFLMLTFKGLALMYLPIVILITMWLSNLLANRISKNSVILFTINLVSSIILNSLIINILQA